MYNYKNNKKNTTFNIQHPTYCTVGEYQENKRQMDLMKKVLFFLFLIPFKQKSIHLSADCIELSPTPTPGPPLSPLPLVSSEYSFTPYPSYSYTQRAEVATRT